MFFIDKGMASLVFPKILINNKTVLGQIFLTIVVSRWLTVFSC